MQKILSFRFDLTCALLLGVKK